LRDGGDGDADNGPIPLAEDATVQPKAVVLLVLVG